MTTKLSPWRIGAVAGASVFMALYLLTALPRVFYPYDLDFIENGMLMQSLRHAQGLPVFIAPSGEFAPNVYMPLYSWLGGLIFQVTGPGYWPLRALSLTATLTTASLIFFIARRESQQFWVALACAGLFLGGYRLSGFWYELIRVDALHVALSLAGVAVGIYYGQTPRGALTAAGLLALAFFTKQTAVLLAGALGVYFLLATPRRAILFGLSFAALTVLPYLALNAVTEGWLFFHTLSIASGDGVQIERVWQYVFAELLGGMAGVSGMLALAVVLAVRRTSGRSLLTAQPWWFGVAGAMLISGVGRASVGGNLNNLMLVYAFLCLTPGLLAREFWRERTVTPRWAEALLTGALLLQFSLGAYNPLRYIPTPTMRAQGDELIARLRAENGPVLVLLHPYYAVLAGKAPSAQMIHLWYFYKYQRFALPEDFASRIRSRYYAAIISDESLFETEPAFADFFRTYYPEVEPLPASASPPTLSGLPARPTLILRP